VPAGELIPVGNIRVLLLLGDGGQGLANSAGYAGVIMREMRHSRDTAPFANLYYPSAGSGYIGTPPYFPVVNTGAGGSQQANALAAELVWTQLIKFLDDPDVTKLSAQR
jgi:hypothetical protein